jgi:hypothetical protein
MKTLTQRVLLAAAFAAGAIAVLNQNLPAGVVAVGVLAVWAFVTYRSRT